MATPTRSQDIKKLNVGSVTPIEGNRTEVPTEPIAMSSAESTPPWITNPITRLVRDKYGNWITRPASDRYGHIIQGADSTWSFQQGGTINKFQRKGGWLFQQGGQMPQEGSQEELVLDFAVRYLVTIGVPEEDIMDPQGNLNPEYQQELEQVFNSQEISWSDYAASPDEYMQQFIGNLQTQTQMARKGAKLKRLSKLKIYKK